jgi:hypothetical protein
LELNHDLSFGSKIKLILDKTGQIEVSGELFDVNVGEHSLLFKFISDQTVIKPFYSALNRDFVVNNNHI